MSISPSFRLLLQFAQSYVRTYCSCRHAGPAFGQAERPRGDRLRGGRASEHDRVVVRAGECAAAHATREQREEDARAVRCGRERRRARAMARPAARTHRVRRGHRIRRMECALPLLCAFSAPILAISQSLQCVSGKY